MLSRLIAVRTSDVCSSEYSSACMTAGIPAADCLGGLTFGFSTPTRGCRPTAFCYWPIAEGYQRRSEDLEFLCDLAHRFLGVTEEHGGAVGVEERVVDAREAGIHR